MRVLFVGGTGLISSAVSPLLVSRGHNLTLINRGTSFKADAPEGAHTIRADVNDTEAFRAAITADVRAHGEYDSVVQWIGFDPDHIGRDIDTFAGITGQYVFISSASAYETPPGFYITREDSTPLANPYWQYSRDKAASENRLRAAYTETGFPFTVVRPSHTYARFDIPAAINSWTYPWTIVDRMQRGAPILVHGDGTSLWTLTDHRDFAHAFAGLVGNDKAIGEEFHITSDDVLTWNQIHSFIASAAGLDPERVHEQSLCIPTDLLVRFDKEAFEGPIKGDKGNAAIFDNSKVRSLVPDYSPQLRFEDTIHESIAWFMESPERRKVDAQANALYDDISARFLRGVGIMFS